LAVVGYVIMRVAQTGQWLRAAASEQGPARVAAIRYAIGLAVVQVGWVVLLLLPHPLWIWGFPVMAAADLAVPAYAERAHPTSWHPRHIAERYGLFTIIVLGETIAAATIAVESAAAAHSRFGALLPIIVGGLLIVFAAYWIYFAVPIHRHLAGNRQAFPWGYGHYVIFSSAAAIGAGLEVNVEQATGSAHLSWLAAAAALTVPTAAFLGTVWLLHARHFKATAAQQMTLPVSAVLVLVSTFAGRFAVLVAGLVAAAAVAVGVTLTRRAPRRSVPG
jgi:low temperature requirement protein LtrA